MKIIQIITKFDDVYGAQKHVIDLSNGLHAEGHDIIILSGSVGLSAQNINTTEIKIIEWKILRHQINLFYDIKCLLKLISFLKKERPDIVASHSSKAGIISRIACWWCGIPNTFTAHGWSFEEGIPFLNRKIFLAIEKVVGRISDKVIVVANAEKELALKHNVLPADKMEVVYYGVNEKKENSLPVKNEIFTMVMVAGLRPQKDHFTLLCALSTLKEFQWKIFFLGDGELEQSIRQQVTKLELDDRCFFQGAIDNVQDYLMSADLMVLTTNWEGLPISILEGLTYSLPVIATDVAGVKEEVIHGYNGFLVRKGNVEDVAKYIKYFLNDTDQVKEMGSHSRIHYEKNFTLHVMIKNTFQIYSEINKL